MLRHGWIGCMLWTLALSWPCAAQEPPRQARRDQGAPAVAEAEVSYARTPEMWIYEQERIRRDDPKMAVRRKAELRGLQRAERLAAQKWFGKSNSRPAVSSTPLWSGYSSYWGSNTYDPNRWRPYYAPIATRPIEGPY
jgi:hypothetical protein